MKKAVKGIIGLSAALAVLGGRLAALTLTGPEKTEESSSIHISTSTATPFAGDVSMRYSSVS